MKKAITLTTILFCFAIALTSCGEKQDDGNLLEKTTEISLSKTEFIGLEYHDVYNQLEENGFTNINTEALDDLTSAEKDKDNIVEKVTIDGNETYKVGTTYMSDVIIKIYYHNIKTVYAPFAADEIPEDELYESVKKQFEDAGFTNIKGEPIEDLIFGWLTKDGQIESVTINGNKNFDDFESFAFDTDVIIKYHTFPKTNAEESGNADTAKENTSDKAQSFTSTENENITFKNNTDFAAALNASHYSDSVVSKFATSNIGKTIEFDGYTAYVENYSDSFKTYSTRFNYTIFTGNADSFGKSTKGPLFLIKNVNYYDLKLSGNNIPDTFSIGLNVHIVAEIKEFNDGIIVINPIKITMR